ncbi:hypothetical protein CC80DRAFT_247944 [Byssothecium circinans]|uniref:Uncharacterized protein n=1 Tax=Byssothecium circinans TaxID=147558 RepID=A0A6A5TCN2_9PLEO|nr:hypothetical protein CC80DRAFT_247944 [Byssothecium circinans]
MNDHLSRPRNRGKAGLGKLGFFCLYSHQPRNEKEKDIEKKRQNGVSFQSISVISMLFQVVFASKRWRYTFFESAHVKLFFRLFLLG